MSPLPSKEEKAGVCGGKLRMSNATCSFEREAQAAGRYLQRHLVPFLCLNPACTEYAKPYSRSGEALDWKDIENQIQIEGVSP